MSVLSFFVNGKKIEETNPNPLCSFLDYLRRRLLLTGTKKACGQGGCGACTVLITRYDHGAKDLRHFSVNACLLPLAWVQGCAVTTIEGLGSTKHQLHPLQSSLADHHGSQCGMCSPGMVMAVQGLLCGRPKPPTVKDIEDTLAGNLCRCTGYRPIFEAFEPFVKENSDLEQFHQVRSLLPTVSVADLEALSSRSVVLRDEKVIWYHPTSLQELLELRAKYPKAPLVMGFTSLFWLYGTQVGRCKPPVVIAGTAVPELSTIEMTEAGLVVGAAITVTRLVDYIEAKENSIIGHQYSGILEMARMLKTGFGNAQLRNIATIGGSIASGSGSSDIITAFIALGGSITVQSQAGKRTIRMGQSFLTQCSRDLFKDGGIIVSTEIPFTNKVETVKMEKHVLRRGAKSLITVAARFCFSDENGKSTISRSTIAIGGFGKSVRLFVPTTDVINLRQEDTLHQTHLIKEALLKDLTGGSYLNKREQKYKLDVAANILWRMLTESCGENKTTVIKESKNDGLRSQQKFLSPPEQQQESDHVGRPLVHHAAYQQCTGEALYLDDIPCRNDELFMAFAKSSNAHAMLRSVDPSEALALPGVVDFISASNIPPSMEGVFASDKVEYHGQPLGVVLAVSRETARQAARIVKVEYQPLTPVLDIESAIHNMAYLCERQYSSGDVTGALHESERIVKGTVRLGSQEHWYLETQCCLAVPGENGELEITIPCHNLAAVQQEVCKAVGLATNKVVVKTKRLGGSFGGKDHGRGVLLAVPTAFAAYKHGQPVRCVLERDEDIILTGQRPPYLAHYKIGAQRDGTINALDMEFYMDGGWSVDNSLGMMEKAMLTVDNCYKLPALRLVGRVCKTNKTSRPSFRGYGAPEAHFLLESALDQCAKELHMEPAELRLKNMLMDGDKAIMNTNLLDCTASKCWEEVLSQSSYDDRRTSVSQFNSCHTSRKRGVYAVPVKMAGTYPLSNELGAEMNRGCAMVNAYQDGTVLVHHAGIEMGQGLHIKMIQVASRVLNIPSTQIHIAETRTDVLANTGSTGASSGSDLNGPAVKDACEKLLVLLKPYMDENSQGKWIDWVNAAFGDRVSLTTVGYFRLEGVHSEKLADGGQTYPYFTYGAGVTEVEIDCLTGKYQILRTDVVMDVGKSLNPAIDIGQIEGAFLQMAGLLTTEKFEYNEDGVIKSTSLGDYILPGIENVPREFNVSLLTDAKNPWPQAIYSSKGIGEPPMTLAVSVFLAMREAIRARREEAGFSLEFPLDAPATPDRVLALCMAE